QRAPASGDFDGAGIRPSRPQYVELHCHSAYSFGDGASAPEELAHRAAEMGYEAIAITDHDGVWGAMEFAQACTAFGVRPIVGAELTITPATSSASRPRPASPDDRSPSAPSPGLAGSFHVTLLVEDADGWRNLCRLVTEAHAGTRPHPGRDALPPSLPLAALEERADGLVCLSGCAREGALAAHFERSGGRPTAADAAAAMAVGRRLAT